MHDPDKDAFGAWGCEGFFCCCFSEIGHEAGEEVARSCVSLKIIEYG
jgi:hypothetical protein